MKDEQVWDEHVPDVLRRVLQQLLDDHARGYDDSYGRYEDPVAEFLDVPEPDPGDDYAHWQARKVGAMTPQQTYGFIEFLAEGRSTYDHRVSDALAADDVLIEMVDGRFWSIDEAAEELEVGEVLAAPSGVLTKKFAPTKTTWDKSRAALGSRDYEVAVAHAVNALESAVRIAASKNKISAGVATLFTGPRAPLGQSLNQLHNYGSAMPGVRHGGTTHSQMTSAEARAVCRACAVWIAMIVELHRSGELPLT